MMIEITSEIIQILNCPDTFIELELTVKPGFYRMRVYSSDMRVYDSDEFDDKDKKDDCYRIDIGTDNNIERNVLKKFIKAIK